MVRALGIAALILLVGAVQTLITRAWLPLGAFDGLMVATGMLALRLSFPGAVVTGALAGLVQDSLGGGLLGLHAFGKTAVAAVLQSTGKVIVVRGPLAEALMIGAAAVGEGLIVRMLLAIVDWPGSESPAWIFGRGVGTSLLVAAFLLGRPWVVMRRERARRRSRIRL